MQEYKEKFIEFLISSQALKFGDFTLKSGRRSPYFINTGCFDDGEKIAKLGYFYANATEEHAPSTNVVFGPSYKGIPLALATSISLKQDFGKVVGYTFNRKEAKDHGDKGVLVGFNPAQNSVTIVDDVITSGKSIRESFEVLKANGSTNIGAVIISVDRMEKGNADKSALQELQSEFKVPVKSIVTIREIIDYLHNREINNTVHLDDARKEQMEEYLSQYGVAQ